MKLVLTPKIEKILNDCQTHIEESFPLSEECFDKLMIYISTACSGYEVKINYLKEQQTTENRQLQLTETKEVVYSLRETDSTTGDALSFLREKLDLLIEERENLVFKFLSFKEEIETTPLFELSSKIKSFVESITFIETESWEEQLDYYRTRFLLQREQETDQNLKDNFLPEDEKQKSFRDPLAKIKTQVDIPSKPVKIINLTKNHHQIIIPYTTKFNKLLLDASNSFNEEILEWSEETITEKLNQQEIISQEVGKELYALKREQGILTMKTYEIIQTIRSRLLNITGSIASRIFFKDGFKDLLQLSKNESLTDDDRKESIKKIITRFLRILGEIKPGL